MQGQIRESPDSRPFIESLLEPNTQIFRPLEIEIGLRLAQPDEPPVVTLVAANWDNGVKPRIVLLINIKARTYIRSFAIRSIAQPPPNKG